jgi:signal peptidase II
VIVKKYILMYAKLLGIVGIVVALDQWTKWLVRQHIPFATQWLPDSLQWLMPYARFVYWHNTGAAFGMFQDGSLVFTVLAFIVIGAILFYYPHIESEGWLFRLALGLQLAGATGNLIDRLTQDGKVTDFISVGIFPVFNIADAAITVGTILLILGVWLNERAEKPRPTAAGKQAKAEAEAQVDGQQGLPSEE